MIRSGAVRLTTSLAAALVPAGVLAGLPGPASAAAPPGAAHPDVRADVRADVRGDAAALVATRRRTPLPGGRPRYVVSVLGGSFNAYWVRLAEYTFTPGTDGSGTVRQSYWRWDQAHFDGTAARNKVRTGYRTAGCAAACDVRTPLGFQPGAGPMGTVTGRYRFDRYGRVVVEWPGHVTEAWTVRASARTARLTLHHTTLGGLYGDGYGSFASFAASATRDQVAASNLTGVQRVATYGDGGRSPVQTSRWGDVVAPMHACRGTGAACLFYTGRLWRSAIVVPGRLGRRAFWQHQKQGVDGDSGACFGSGGGHTVALLQILDDRGRFLGFVGAEASFNGRSRHNAVVAQLVLT